MRFFGSPNDATGRPGFTRGFYIAGIDRRLRQQSLDAEVVLVISNNSRAGALRRADAAGIAKQHISGKTHGSQEGQTAPWSLP